MLNVYAAEVMKIRRSRVFRVCLLFAALVPIFIIQKDVLAQTAIVEQLSVQEWTTTMLQISLLLVYPILSAFVITNMMQKEYTEYTIINTITAPVSRVSFFVGKLLIWLTWQLSITILCYLLTFAGCAILYPDAISASFALTLAGDVFSASMLSFLSFLPILCIAILQRKTFYPALIACLICVGIATFVTIMPLSLSNILPWSAVVVYLLSGTVYMSGMISIAICAILSVAISLIAIKKQDL